MINRRTIKRPMIKFEEPKPTLGEAVSKFGIRITDLCMAIARETA